MKVSRQYIKYFGLILSANIFFCICIDFHTVPTSTVLMCCNLCYLKGTGKHIGILVYETICYRCDRWRLGCNTVKYTFNNTITISQYKHYYGLQMVQQCGWREWREVGIMEWVKLVGFYSVMQVADRTALQSSGMISLKDETWTLNFAFPNSSTSSKWTLNNRWMSGKKRKKKKTLYKKWE